MIFDTNQIKELLDIIDMHHTLFIANNVGIDILTDEDLSLLKEHGIDVKKIAVEHPTITQAFKFGVLADSLGDKNTKQLNYEDFKKYLKSGNFIPLTDREEEALEAVKHQSYNDIKGLGNRVGNNLNQIHIEVDQELRRRKEKIIEETAKEVIEERKSVRDMVSRLGHKMGDWNRDLGRISEYIMHSSYEEGRAASLEKKGGRDILVYKDVFPGACRWCMKHYLTGGVGSQPIIFRLSELKANGSNIGRKQVDWDAVVGPMHPWCRCTMGEVPEGFDWDPRVRSFTKLKPLIRKVERKSKIRITVGEKNFEV